MWDLSCFHDITARRKEAGTLSKENYRSTEERNSCFGHPLHYTKNSNVAFTGRPLWVPQLFPPESPVSTSLLLLVVEVVTLATYRARGGESKIDDIRDFL